MKCECTTKHVPKPVFLYDVLVPGYGEIALCPTSYSNLIEYIREWDERGERPPGSVRKHYSAYIQDLAEASKNGI